MLAKINVERSKVEQEGLVMRPRFWVQRGKNQFWDNLDVFGTLCVNNGIKFDTKETETDQEWRFTLQQNINDFLSVKSSITFRFRRIILLNIDLRIKRIINDVRVVICETRRPKWWPGQLVNFFSVIFRKHFKHFAKKFVTYSDYWQFRDFSIVLGN
jgi:hypothetical protein